MITGELLRDTRARLQESQTTFADRFGVDQATVSRWETEGPPQSGISAKMIERVLDDLGALPQVTAAPAEARA